MGGFIGAADATVQHAVAIPGETPYAAQQNDANAKHGNERYGMKAEFTMTYTFLVEGSSKEQLVIKRDLLLATISDARREADNAGYGYLLHGRDSALKYEGETKCDCCGK